MSAGVGIWRQALARATHLRVHEQELETPIVTAAEQEPFSMLARQLFLSGVPRKRILVTAVGPETRIVEICEEIGRRLCEQSGRSVAAIVSTPPFEAEVSFKKRPRSVGEKDFWLCSGTQLADKFWRLPASLLCSTAAGDQSGSATSAEIPFDYILCASLVGDSLTPLMCNICDGAVLVLTANKTHRDAALRAKEILRQCNAQLLGTILDGREFPIPESIYRRL